MMQARIIVSTINNQSAGEALVTQLVSEGLIACGNLLPSTTSIYRWQGKIERESEILIILKTRAERLSELEERYHELHPYEVPEFVVLTPETVSKPYLQWLLDETEPSEAER
jgi:periplasmic divalent cation tolerance protein